MAAMSKKDFILSAISTLETLANMMESDWHWDSAKNHMLQAARDLTYDVEFYDEQYACTKKPGRDG